MNTSEHTPIRCTCDQARPAPPYAEPSAHADGCPIRVFAEQLSAATFGDAPVTNGALVKLRDADARLKDVPWVHRNHRCEHRAAAADRKLYADEIYRLLKLECAVSDQLANQLTQAEATIARVCAFVDGFEARGDGLPLSTTDQLWILAIRKQLDGDEVSRG